MEEESDEGRFLLVAPGSLIPAAELWIVFVSYYGSRCFTACLGRSGTVFCRRNIGNSVSGFVVARLTFLFGSNS